MNNDLTELQLHQIDQASEGPSLLKILQKSHRFLTYHGKKLICNIQKQ